MGGHAGGEIASNIVCRTFKVSFQKAEILEPSARLLEALHNANKQILETGKEYPRLFGMGSILLGVIFLIRVFTG